MLDEERKVYEENLEEWLKTNSGDFVVIKGSEVLGFCQTQEEAITAGGKQFGLSSFLVRKVQITDEQFSAPALAIGLPLAHSS